MYNNMKMRGFAVTVFQPPGCLVFLKWLHPLPPSPPLPPGLVADCSLTDYVPLSCGPHSTDNDGLWTSWLVAAEALRFSVTRDPAARENAWALFTGLRFLVNVSHANTVLRDALVELLKFLYCQE